MVSEEKNDNLEKDGKSYRESKVGWKGN